jgi:predicted metal-binding protein
MIKLNREGVVLIEEDVIPSPEFTEGKSMIRTFSIKPEQMVLLKDSGRLCRLPYPAHPNGCPNYGKLEDCPPRAPYLFKFFDKNQKFCLVVYEFNMMEHMAKMRLRNPKWSDKQLRNVYYWQNTVRAKLNQVCRNICNLGFDRFTLKPEAMGLNLFATMRKFGLKLKKNPTDIVYKIALVGHRKRNKGEWRF